MTDMDDDIVSELNLRVTSVLSSQLPVYSSMPQLPNDFLEGTSFEQNMMALLHIYM